LESFQSAITIKMLPEWFFICLVTSLRKASCIHSMKGQLASIAGYLGRFTPGIHLPEQPNTLSTSGYSEYQLFAVTLNGEANISSWYIFRSLGSRANW
jgi:hypothetical protein